VQLLSADGDQFYDFAAPVMVGEFQVGTIRLGLLRTQVTSTVTELWWAIFAFAILSIVVSDAVGFSLARNLTSRIKRLQAASEDMIMGHREANDATPLSDVPRITAGREPDKASSPQTVGRRRNSSAIGNL
jgi:hypothetical protein